MRTRPGWRSTFAVLTMAAAAGCASGGQGQSGERMAPRDVITYEQLQDVEGRTTALQLIERLQPSWLQSRGPVNTRGDTADVVVYVNGQRLAGGREQLSRYVAAELQELRHLSAMEATQRFGTGHTSGAILIVTR